MGRDLFCERLSGFSVRKLLRTIFTYLIVCQGLGLRFWVMLIVRFPFVKYIYLG